MHDNKDDMTVDHVYESDIVLLHDHMLHMFREGKLLWHSVSLALPSVSSILLRCYRNKCAIFRANGAAPLIVLQMVDWETGAITVTVDLWRQYPLGIRSAHVIAVPSGVLFLQGDAMRLITWDGISHHVPSHLRYHHADHWLMHGDRPHSIQPPFAPLHGCSLPPKHRHIRATRFKLDTTSVCDTQWQARRLNLNLSLLDLPAGLAPWIGTLGARGMGLEPFQVRL